MEEPTLSTREAADRLGVKPETVYAYVSRGLLSRSGGPRRGGSRFSAAEVDRLAASRRGGGAPASEGVAELVASGLTLLTDDRLYFRGHDAAGLAASTDLAGVATLLWDTPEPVRFTPLPDAVAVARGVVAALPDGARLGDRLRVAVTALAAADPWRFDLAPAHVTRTGAGLIGSLLAVLGPPDDDAELSPGARLWPALTGGAPGDDAAGIGDLDAALVLLADHGLAASTLTARVAASARAHPYAVVSAGLGALDGPYHGTASTAAHRLLADALTDGPEAAIAERVRSGEYLPGFGHAVYTARDPRAAVLLDRLAGTTAGTTAAELAAVVATRRELFGNVDLGLAALVHAHGMRPDAAETIFALARTVGWIAHALEEYGEPGLRFRVRGRYTGPEPGSTRVTGG